MFSVILVVDINLILAVDTNLRLGDCLEDDPILLRHLGVEFALHCHVALNAIRDRCAGSRHIVVKHIVDVVYNHSAAHDIGLHLIILLQDSERGKLILHEVHLRIVAPHLHCTTCATLLVWNKLGIHLEVLAEKTLLVKSA